MIHWLATRPDMLMGHPLATLVLLSMTGASVAPDPVAAIVTACLPACGGTPLIVSAAPVGQDQVVAVGDAIPLGNGDGRLRLDGRWGRTRSGGPSGARIADLGASWAGQTVGPATGANGAYRLMRWVVLREAPLRPHRI